MSTADLLESAIHQHQKIEPNEETHIQSSISSDGNYTEVTGSKSNNHEILKKGSMQYGRRHYRRRCQIRAPCCNKIFDCRYCHNEAKDESNSLYLQGVDKIRCSAVECFRETFKNSIDVDTTKRREVPRHVVRQVVCSMCGTEQEVRQICINCGVCMGSYFCQICKLFDDDARCCYSNMLRNSHACVEGGMHHDCPICFEEMKEHCQFACPFCSKSVCESKACERLDRELATMPDSYDDKMVQILCNDCGAISEVQTFSSIWSRTSAVVASPTTLARSEGF